LKLNDEKSAVTNINNELTIQTQDYDEFRRPPSIEIAKLHGVYNK